MTDVPDPHLTYVRPVTARTPGACEECVAIGTRWVHLRLCLTCGKVSCCDSSPMKHARAHALHDMHPIARSLEPGESWRWCYIDDNYV